MKFVFHTLLYFILSIQLALASSWSYSFQNQEEEQRFHVLTKEIRCLVCQGQSIADSNAPLAKDLRLKIYEMMMAQASDQDIKSYLVSRYGKFILLKPPLEKATLLLWSFPLLGLLLGLIILLKHLKSRI